jgi:hypothetical protein
MAVRDDSRGRGGGNAGREKCDECVFCLDRINSAAQHTVVLAGCRHCAHYECFFGANLVRRISSCPHCIPEQGVNDDYGDCIYVKEMHLDAYVRSNVEIALGLRVNEYKISEIISQADTVARLDDNETTAEHVSRLIRKTGGVPARPLQPWLPGLQDRELVRSLLASHISPKNLCRDGVDVVTILNSGVVLDDLLRWNYTLKEIHDIGFDMRTLVALGFRAGHLRNKASVSVMDVRNVFKMTFEDIIQLENKFFTKSFAALVSYCDTDQDYQGHRALGLPNLQALQPHGLNGIALLILAKNMSLKDLVSLGLDYTMLEDYDMINATDLRELGVQDPKTAAALLGCTPQQLSPVLPSLSTVCPNSVQGEAKLAAKHVAIPPRSDADAVAALMRANPEHTKLMHFVFN